MPTDKCKDAISKIDGEKVIRKRYFLYLGARVDVKGKYTPDIR